MTRRVTVTLEVTEYTDEETNGKDKRTYNFELDPHTFSFSKKQSRRAFQVADGPRWLVLSGAIINDDLLG